MSRLDKTELLQLPTLSGCVRTGEIIYAQVEYMIEVVGLSK